MEIHVRQENNSVIVSIKGRIDAITSTEFEASLKALIEKDRKFFLLNFMALEYISSAGLRSILAIAKLLKAKNGQLAFTMVQDTVRNVFRISGFESMFPIYESEEEAIQNFPG